MDPNMNDNHNARRSSDDGARHHQGGDRDFTSLEIPPDYGDTGSGEYDNDYGNDRRSPSRNNNNNNNNNNHHSNEINNRTPDSGMVNTGFEDDGDQTDGRNARETIELKRVTEIGDKNTIRHRGHHGTFHRRAKSQHQNGYDYYYRRHRREKSSGYTEPQPDYPSDEEISPERTLHPEDIVATLHFLKNLKVRRKTSKKKGLGSSKRRDEDGDGDGLEGGGAGYDYEARVGGDEGDSQDGESFEEEIGLPSAREKTKGLSEKMLLAKQLDSAAEVARQYEKRDSLWEVKHRTSSLRRSRKKTSGITRAGRSFKDWFIGVWYKLSFWSPHFKEIEGQCGIATTTYFRFTRWLVKINLLVFLIFLSFLYVPQFITWAEPSKNIFIEETPLNVSKDQDGLWQSVTCSNVYGNYVENISDYTGIPVVLDIVKGTGFLEDTFIFYGRYSNLSITYQSTLGGSEYRVSTDFNMSLVYMLVMLGSFLIIFIMVVKTSSMSVKETIMGLDNKAIASYSNSILAGWDYCINSEKMAFYKQRIIYNDFQAKLEEVRIKRRQQMRTSQERAKLYFRRFLINVLVLCILGGCFTAIVFVTNFLLEKQEEDLGEIESLLIEFLPSIVITFINFIIPIIFMLLVEKEEYSPTVSTSLTIIRAVFLRISLVGVLLFSIYYRLFHKRDRDAYSCPEEELSDLTTTCCGNPLWKTATVTTGEEKGSVKCWETYVGQQFYKLAIADFFNVCVAYFGACALRKFVHSKLKDRFWFVKKVGLARFDLPLEVLDIVYTQTLCWVGMFFAPLLPTFCLFQTFIYFFNKKYLLLKLCEPPKNNYRASRNYSFFQVVLLATFTVICIVLGYMIGNIQPSKSCGPFRVWATPDYVMFDAITNEVDTWPAVPRGAFNLFGTVAFLIPAFLILGMAIYYYWAVSLGYKRLEKLLQQQLKSESYDKQYLLARVDEAIKQGNLNLHHDAF